MMLSITVMEFPKGQLLLIVLALDLICNTSGDSNCMYESFEAQKDFDEQKFEGKWYEVAWILPHWIPIEWNFHDYFHIKTRTDYGFSVLAQGRWPADKETCESPSYPKLYRTDTTGKYLYEFNGENNTLINASQIIVDTDYYNYALVIGCRATAANGTCEKKDGWLWTRCQNPPMGYVNQMEKRLADFCLGREMFSTTEQHNDCRSDTPNQCESRGHRIQGLHKLCFLTTILRIITSFL